MANQMNQNVNVAELPNIKCQCGSELFQSVMILKKVSVLQSPTGKEEIFPVPIVTCFDCGKTLDDIMKFSSAS